LWVPFAFQKSYFHEIKGRKHSADYTTDDNTGLTESFSTSTEWHNACMGIKFVSETWFLKTYFLTMLGQNHM
jgi:hypothetical protein